MSLLDLTNKHFLDELASASPAPGGGSVAALAGALGTALGSMVCRLTIGKKKYADMEAELTTCLEDTERLRDRLAMLVDEDTSAFNLVMSALAMSKETSDEKQKRAAALESATKEATMVPLSIMQCTKETAVVAMIIAQKGNINALSDAGVCALMLQASCRGAYYNVRINLAGLHDAGFVATIRQQADELLTSVDGMCRDITTHVESRLG